MEQEIKDLIESLKPIISNKGFLISGNGMVANNTAQTNEILDKIQKFGFFMESRQKRMEEQNQEIIGLLRQISTKLK